MSKSTYQARLSLDKAVSSWSNEDGAGNDYRTMMDEKTIVESSTLDRLKSEIDEWLKNFSLNFKDFLVFGEDDEKNGRRFTFSQIEDDDGSPDDKGSWIADYNLYVTIMKSQEVKCPKFGLKDG